MAKTERERRLTRLGVAVILFAGIFSLHYSGLPSIGKGAVAVVLLALAAISDETTIFLLACVSITLLARTFI